MRTIISSIKQACHSHRLNTGRLHRFIMMVFVPPLLLAACHGQPETRGIAMVEEGTPVGVIVLREDAESSLRETVEYFVATVERSTGAALAVVAEEEAKALPKRVPRMVIGPSDEASMLGIAPSDLQPETYRILTRGNTVIVTGAEDTHSVRGPASRPTLWALNHLLETQLGVRWLWPGKLGTHVPAQNQMVIPSMDVTYQPPLLIRSLRLIIPREGNFAVCDAAFDAEQLRDALQWAENHQSGRRGGLRFGHAFGHWWNRYAGDHPDYFAELPDGHEQPFPMAGRVKLRLANPDVIEQIAREYLEAGAPDYYNVCPNDGSGFDISAETRAWDIPADQPVADIFAARANLTARYVEFWNRLYDRLAAINPEVTLCSYAYSAYRYPPPPERPLKARMALQIVDSYNAHDTWSAWAESGAELVLRPNWWHQGADAPYLPLEATAAFIRFAWDNGMIGMDMDSVLGFWATQGLNYYLAARMMNEPEIDLETIIQEYLSAFGKGAPAIRNYVDYWQQVSEIYNYPINASSEIPDPSVYMDLVRAGTISGSILNGSKQALPHLYGDDVLNPAFEMLDEAKALIGTSEPLALRRVAFLRAGLESLRMTRDQMNAANQVLKTRDPDHFKAFEQRTLELVEFRRVLAEQHPHAIWPAQMKWYEHRYSLPLWPENLGKQINLDGL